MVARWPIKQCDENEEKKSIICQYLCIKIFVQEQKLSEKYGINAIACESCIQDQKNKPRLFPFSLSTIE